jgi:excinuclease ABC subunit C
MPLQKINLDIDFKSTMEELIGAKIYVRNSFGAQYEKNHGEIQNLIEQGSRNASIYLDRNRLGQKLSMFDENRLYTSVVQLGEFLHLDRTPRRIECFDISHLQGRFVYGSMVVFIDGRPCSKYYRLFKCPDQNNDFENHKNVMRRRLQKGLDYLNGVTTDKGWQLPDLIIVDGGKGQLSSDYEVLCEFGLQDKVNMVSLAKQEEEIFSPLQGLPTVPNFTFDPETFKDYKLGKEGGLLTTGEMKFLLLRISDEAHRFAIKNNRNARIKSIKKTALDGIDGIGEITRNKLLSKFGSSQNLVTHLYDNPEMVYELVGGNITEKLKVHFGVV